MRLRLPESLLGKLLLGILPLVAAAVGGIVWLQYDRARSELLGAVDKELRLLAQRTASNIDDLLAQRYGELFTLSETPLLADYYHNVDFGLLAEAESYRKEIERYLLNFSRRGKAYASISFLDAGGLELCRIERDKALAHGARWESSEAFIEGRRLGPGRWWLSSLRRLEGGKPALYYAKPVHDERGRLKGMLVLCYDLASWRSILEKIEVGKRGGAYVRVGEDELFSEFTRALGGAERLSAESRLNALPWTVVVQAPLEDFLGPLRAMRDAALGTVLLGLLALGVVLFVLVRSMTRPIGLLARAARAIGAGELGHRVREPISGELGALGAAFNEMASGLEANRKRNAELQAQLIQAEKLSAVGQLISAVAHELNNPLAAVYGYSQILLQDGPAAELRGDLQHIYGNAQRCRKVVDNLLLFVRRSRHERKRVDLNEAVRAALELLEYRLLKTDDVRVDPELSEALPETIGDFQQIVQVLLNLINNACDAMEGVSRYPEGRRLGVRTWAEGPWVAVSVSDNGTGIAPGARERIFEPFFTTKEPGKGTGLGLAICRQIVEQHGGKIELDSRRGEGACFVLRFPLVTEAELGAVKEPPSESWPAVPGRRVLVVDDEQEIAQLIARVLREDGDEATVAHLGLEALKLLESDHYDLVVSDIEMERVKGQDLFARLAKRYADPASRVLFVTGDILNPKVLEFLAKARAPYLVKPFDISDLRRTLRRLLAARAGS